jgi:hypothetical protein
MPDLATIQAAIPKCPRTTHKLGGPMRRCGKPMTYMMLSNAWRCSRCMQTIKGTRVAVWVAEADAALDEAA